MQTTQIISPQSRAAGQPPLMLSRAEQSPSGIGGDGDGFLAILSEHEGARVDPVCDAIAAEAAEGAALAPAVVSASFPRLLSVIAATEAPVSSEAEADPVTATSGQRDLVLPDGSQAGSAVSGPSGPGVPDLAAQSGDPGVGTATGGAQSASPAPGNQVVAPLPEGGRVALSQELARPRAGTDGPPGKARQDPDGNDQLPHKAASRSSGTDTFFPASKPDLNAASAETALSATDDAALKPLQASDALPVAIAATPSNMPLAAAIVSSSSGSLGAEGSGVAQGSKHGSKGSMPDGLPAAIRVSRDGSLSEGTGTPNAPETTMTRQDAADEIRGQQDPPPPAELSRGEQTVRVLFPTTAAESLWRGAALVRLEGSMAASNGPAEMPPGSASPVMTAEAIKPIVVTGADRSALQAAAPAFSAQGPLQGSVLAAAPGEKITPASFSLRHSTAHIGEPSGGPTLQLAQAATAGVQMVPMPDPALPDPTLLVEGEALTEPDPAWPLGFAGGSASAMPLSGTASPAGPNFPSSVVHLSSQITTAVAQNPDGATEIALSPEELGRVHMTLQADALQSDRMVIFLSFDRPETLELFRRHSDHLAEAMRMAGYSGADINFGQSGTGADGNSGAGTNQARPGQDDGSSRGLAQSASRASDPTIGPGDLNAPRHGAGSALDLRL